MYVSCVSVGMCLCACVCLCMSVLCMQVADTLHLALRAAEATATPDLCYNP